MDTKSFIETLSQNMSRSKPEVQNLISAFSNVLADKCSAMDTVAIPGFGAFEPRKRGERISVNPATGKRMLVPPKIQLVFRPSALLKQKLNKQE